MKTLNVPSEKMQQDNVQCTYLYVSEKKLQYTRPDDITVFGPCSNQFFYFIFYFLVFLVISSSFFSLIFYIGLMWYTMLPVFVAYSMQFSYCLHLHFYHLLLSPAVNY